MQVVFRVDASREIGTGHLMRCLTLADALTLRGVTSCFVSRQHPGHLFDVVRRRGHALIELPGNREAFAKGSGAPAHAAWLGCDWRIDAEQTSAEIGQIDADWLIVDNYALDSAWEKSLMAPNRRLMVIDDLADRTHDCDLLLDQNLVEDCDHRYDDKVPGRCAKLLGPEFALIQPIFAELRRRGRQTSGRIGRILISFGGVDANNMAGMAVQAFLSLRRPDIEVDLVIGSSSPHLEQLRAQIGGNSNVSLHCDLPTLAPLMARADLAIGAAGTMTWERLCLGLPALIVTLAANQQPIAKSLQQHGLARWLGQDESMRASEFEQALKEIVDAGIDPEYAERAYAIVDGLGVGRVSARLADVR